MASTIEKRIAMLADSIKISVLLIKGFA
jgi:hypothetical protein